MPKNRRKTISKPIPVRLDPALLSRIEAVSEQLGEAKSTVMRMAMRLGLEKLEVALKSESAPVAYPSARDQFSTAEERPGKGTK